MKIGDLVRFKHHGYLGVIVELYEDMGAPWALIHWVSHPTLSRYQPQHDLEVVNENR